MAHINPKHRWHWMHAESILNLLEVELLHELALVYRITPGEAITGSAILLSNVFGVGCRDQVDTEKAMAGSTFRPIPRAWRSE